MKVKNIIDMLKNCDPEDEVYMYRYDRGDTAEIEDIRTVNEDTMPYDRNGIVEYNVEKNGSAVLICDYRW